MDVAGVQECSELRVKLTGRGNASRGAPEPERYRCGLTSLRFEQAALLISLHRMLPGAGHYFQTKIFIVCELEHRLGQLHVRALCCARAVATAPPQNLRGLARRSPSLQRTACTPHEQVPSGAVLRELVTSRCLRDREKCNRRNCDLERALRAELALDLSLGTRLSSDYLGSNCIPLYQSFNTIACEVGLCCVSS